MSASNMAFILGLFAVPAFLLWFGHALRHRTPLQRAAFWGASAGYFAGVLITTGAALLPPVHWNGGAAARALAVHWTLLLATVLGGGVGALRARL